MPDIITLKPEQYPVLKGVADGLVPPPEASIAVVAVEGDLIVGRLFLMCPPHIEGTWVHESKRGSGLFCRLIKQAEKEVSSRGASKIFSFAPNEQIENYLQRLGYTKEPLTVWSKNLTPCQ